MSSKQVMDEGKTADAVVEAMLAAAGEVARRRAAQFAGMGMRGAPGAEAIEALLRADARALTRRRDDLRAADEALAAELGDDAAVLAARDRYAELVRARLVELRDVLGTACGATALRELGFAGETPRDPVALEALGATVHARLAAAPPRASRRGVRLDVKALTEGMEAEVDGLRRANADLRRERREEQLARARRDEAWAAFTRALSSTADAFDAQLRAVGMDDVADRVMPTPRGAPAKPEAPTPAPA